MEIIFIVLGWIVVASMSVFDLLWVLNLKEFAPGEFVAAKTVLMIKAILCFTLADRFKED